MALAFSASCLAFSFCCHSLRRLPNCLSLSPGFLVGFPRHFGFCYGVENAIEIAYKAVHENPGKRIFLLSQMIHNPGVNEDLQSYGTLS